MSDIQKVKQEEVIYCDDESKWDKIKEKFDDILYEILPRFLYRFLHNLFNLSMWRGKIRRFFQRIIRGWDDSDTWSLDTTFYQWFLPRFKRFQELNCGYPCGYETFEQWDNELKEKIYELEMLIKYMDDNKNFPINKYLTSEFIKEFDINENKIKNNKSYHNLWAYTACLENFNNWFGKKINHLWW